MVKVKKHKRKGHKRVKDGNIEYVKPAIIKPYERKPRPKLTKKTETGILKGKAKKLFDKLLGNDELSQFKEEFKDLDPNNEEYWHRERIFDKIFEALHSSQSNPFENMHFKEYEVSLNTIDDEVIRDFDLTVKGEEVMEESDLRDVIKFIYWRETKENQNNK
jgi:hypothetical protein